MIKKVIIKNFQPYKSVEIDLNPGITVISGFNDEGKSAFFRAINWVAQNTLTGGRFIHRGEKFASVELQFDDGVTVKKIRKGNSNKYVVDGKHEYKAMKAREIPKEVKDALRLTDVNLQSQHDDFFLIDKSPDYVAKKLNEVSGISDSIKTLDITAKLIRDSNSEKRVLDKQKIELENELSKYEGLDDINEQVNNLLAIQTKIDALEERSKKCEQLLMKINNINEKINELSISDKTKNAINRLLEINEEGKKIRIKRDKVSQAVNSLSSANNSIEELFIPKNINTVLKQLANIGGIGHALEEKQQKIKNILENTLTINYSIATRKLELKQLKNQLSKVKICEACGRPL